MNAGCATEAPEFGKEMRPRDGDGWAASNAPATQVKSRERKGRKARKKTGIFACLARFAFKRGRSERQKPQRPGDTERNFTLCLSVSVADLTLCPLSLCVPS